MAKDLVGTRVAGRFHVKRLLGEGGMARVYVAEQSVNPREVALKIMSGMLTADPRFVKRFEREAMTASRVKHPNSVEIYDWGSSDGLSYIAMELLVGSDLASLLDRDSITQKRVAWITAEVCDALATAHELGIVHRDLKPENVMILPDAVSKTGERIKVLDFGIAKMLFEEGTADEPPDSDNQPTALTRAGTSLGTPAYMSPEQCQLLAIDARSDIYTCGILLYQMTTGGVPFEGETPLHTASMHIHEPVKPPREYAPHIDPRLEAIILQALSKKADQRQASAGELAEALRAILPTLPDKPARLGAPPPSGRKSQPHGRNAPPPPAAGAPALPKPLPPPRMPAPFRSPTPMPRSIDIDDPPTNDDDAAPTMMREAPSLEAAKAIEEEPTLDSVANPALPVQVTRRGTEILDFNAPVASPSLDAQVPLPALAPAPLAPAASPPVVHPALEPAWELAPPRARARRGMSGLGVLLLGFAVGIAIIGVALAGYALFAR